MEHAWLYIAVALVALGIAGLAGGLLSERRLVRYQAPLVVFAAGALLGAVFLDILPESIATFGKRALPWSLASFIVLAILEWAAGHHHHTEDKSPPKRLLPLTLLASDALHNVGDGAAIAAAFLVSTRAGVAMGLAIVAHEVPQEVGDYAVLRAAGYSRRRSLAALAAVQLTAVVGAVGVIVAAGRLPNFTGAMLSIAAGTFLYIGATDLLPEIHSGHSTVDRRERLAGFLSGVAFIAIASLCAGE